MGTASGGSDALLFEELEDPGLERVIGIYGGHEPGPLMIVVGGMHGNEPAGVHAARRVFKKLQENRPRMRGRLVALAGNIAALAQRERFLAFDLNRVWPSDIDVGVPCASASCAGEDASERREQRELLAEIERHTAGERTRVIFLDLHSTSAFGPPFSVIGDTLQNRVIATALGVPVILGLEENVDGTLLGYFGARGHTAIGLEGGQSTQRSTVENHESAIWLALIAGGLLDEAQVGEQGNHKKRLREAAQGLPGIVELRMRHGIEPGEEFEMVPGFVNFQRVERGTLLAHSGRERKEVRARIGGILLLPRYQGKGQDGFFIGREVHPFWLWLSAHMRRLHVERLLALMPGVRRERRDVLAVDLRIARFLARQIFHLLGYRGSIVRENRILFTRRREEL